VDNHEARLKSLESKMDDIQPLLEFVKTKKVAEDEWLTFVRELRLKVASGGVMGLIGALFLLIWWGAIHWVKNSLH
jgi:hypothetical protein